MISKIKKMAITSKFTSMPEAVLIPLVAKARILVLMIAKMMAVVKTFKTIGFIPVLNTEILTTESMKKKPYSKL